MGIEGGMCWSFPEECFRGIHDLEGDTLKLALYLPTATINRDTTAYTATGEVSGSGYTAAGKAVSGVNSMMVGGRPVVDFDDVSWASLTLPAAGARGALLYNSSKSNRAICVIDFGRVVTCSGGTLNIILPAALAATAIIRGV